MIKTMTFKKTATGLLSGLMLSLGSAQAATISATDFRQGATEASSAQVVREQANVAVGAGDVTVDFLASDLVAGTEFNGVTRFASGSTLAAGTYDSFLVHFDPDITSGTARTIGQYDFGARIVALIVSNNSGSRLLGTSDAVFGLSGATFDTRTGRRTEDHDLLTLVDPTTLAWNLVANSNHVDNVRVITEIAPVPLPAGAALLLSAVGGLAFMRRKTKA